VVVVYTLRRHSVGYFVCLCVCEGAKSKMTQHFHGYLAGLSLLRNSTEDDRVTRCLNECREKLDFTPIDTLDDSVNSINSSSGSSCVVNLWSIVSCMG